MLKRLKFSLIIAVMNFRWITGFQPDVVDLGFAAKLDMTFNETVVNYVEDIKNFKKRQSRHPKKRRR